MYRKSGVPEDVLYVASEIFHNLTVSAILNFTRCVQNNHSILHCVTVAGSYSGEEEGCSHIRLGLSMYYVHILRWFSIFPRNQILLLRLEDLVSNSSGSMNKVWSFLEVATFDKVIQSKVNQNPWIRNKKYKNYFKMWPKTRNILKEFFNPYNSMLAKLLHDKSYLWKE